MDASLRPMTATEYDGWRDHAIASYAEDLARATGLPHREMTARATSQFAEMLPAGLDTRDTMIFVVVDDHGLDVGTLWLGPTPTRPSAIYVYDVVINPDRRGEGLGRTAMALAEAVALDTGYESIALSVFGFNTGAKALYDSLGYRTVSTQMSKPLGR